MRVDNSAAAVRSPEIALTDLPSLPPSYPVPAVIAEMRRVFVERGLALRGELGGCDHLRIAGHIESDVALHLLDILDEGSFKGLAAVDKAYIAGRYEGTLTVAETLFVGPAARISGSVQCGKLELIEGGKIDGELRVLAEEAKRAQAAEEDTALEALLLEAAPGTEADMDDDVVESAKALASGPVDAMLVSAAAAENGASLDEAEATFRAALEANLCDVAALSGLGHLARQRGDLAGALHYFELIMAADAENISVRCVSIDILRALSRHDEAAAMAKEVLALRAQQSSVPEGDAPDDQMVLPGFDDAEAMFKTVLDRHPKNLGALAGLGHLARRRGDREAMHRYYTAALALEPMNITLRVEVARAFKEQGDVALARQILETVLTEHRGSHAAG